MGALTFGSCTGICLFPGIPFPPNTFTFYSFTQQAAGKAGEAAAAAVAAAEGEDAAAGATGLAGGCCMDFCKGPGQVGAQGGQNLDWESYSKKQGGQETAKPMSAPRVSSEYPYLESLSPQAATAASTTFNMHVCGP